MMLRAQPARATTQPAVAGDARRARAGREALERPVRRFQGHDAEARPRGLLPAAARSVRARRADERPRPRGARRGEIGAAPPCRARAGRCSSPRTCSPTSRSCARRSRCSTAAGVRFRGAPGGAVRALRRGQPGDAPFMRCIRDDARPCNRRLRAKPGAADRRRRPADHRHARLRARRRIRGATPANRAPHAIELLRQLRRAAAARAGRPRPAADAARAGRGLSR